MDVKAYFERINYLGSSQPTEKTLRDLHLAHLLSVPFENLDIHLGHAIILDEDRFFDKIVHRRRGGFCYELNGLFSALLRTLGFPLTLHSARVFEGENPGPEFDHLVIVVYLQERFLVDVGFGDSFRQPLLLDKPGIQTQSEGNYQISHVGEQWEMHQLDPDGKSIDGYAFTLFPRRLEEFSAMCHFHQTSPESSFTRKRVCSLATPTGRVTLSDMRLILTQNEQRIERLLESPQEYNAALQEYFMMEL